MLWLCFMLACSVAAEPDAPTVEKSYVVNSHPDSGRQKIKLMGTKEFQEGDIKISTKQGRGAAMNVELWTNGIIPFEFHKDMNEEEKAVVQTAIKDFHNYTCIRWVPKDDTHTNYISFRTNKDGCWSYMGMVMPEQIISLGRYGCVFVATALHEMMHAIGFHHEQVRNDRDEYLKINWDNIVSGWEPQFDKLTKRENVNLSTGYDYYSIMHYYLDAASKNGERTMEPTREVDNELSRNEIGWGTGLTNIDIEEINKLYEKTCCGDRSSAKKCSKVEQKNKCYKKAYKKKCAKTCGAC